MKRLAVLIVVAALSVAGCQRDHPATFQEYSRPIVVELAKLYGTKLLEINTGEEEITFKVEHADGDGQTFIRASYVASGNTWEPDRIESEFDGGKHAAKLEPTDPCGVVLCGGTAEEADQLEEALVKDVLSRIRQAE